MIESGQKSQGGPQKMAAVAEDLTALPKAQHELSLSALGQKPGWRRGALRLVARICTRLP